MKQFFKKISDSFISKPDLSQTGQFFKKVSGTQSVNNNAQNPNIIDKITSLNRIIVKGQQKDFLMFRIRHIITEAQLGHNIPIKLQDACEVVHFALLNNIPVLVSKVKLIHPEFDMKDQIIIDERQFEQNQKQGKNDKKEDVEIFESQEQPRDQSDYYENQRHKWGGNKKQY